MGWKSLQNSGQRKNIYTGMGTAHNAMEVGPKLLSCIKTFRSSADEAATCIDCEPPLPLLPFPHLSDLSMEDAHELQLHIRGSPKDEVADDGSSPLHSSKSNHRRWWLALCTCAVLVGQTAATLLGRFYYDQGGKSKWMGALVTSAGFPLLVPVLLLLPSSSSPRTTTPLLGPGAGRVVLTYLCLGLAGAVDNLLYSYGLLYLPVSTFSLVCATQLAFNVVFSYFLNAQKLTSLVVNSVVLLTFSAALLAVSSDQRGATASHASRAKYPLGYLLTLAASALFSLILSSTQLAFRKVVLGRREGSSSSSSSVAVVLEMLVCVSFVSTAASVAGLFASGEWRGLRGEMDGFITGKASYLATLASIALCWTVSGVGGMGLTFAVSSLFSNVISTLGLPVVPLFAMAFFHDGMDGVKVVAMLIAIWGFLSYIYQDYLDDLRSKKKKNSCAATNNAALK